MAIKSNPNQSFLLPTLLVRLQKWVTQQDKDHKVVYIQTTEKTALAYHEKELVGHGTEAHQRGFGTPIGKLKGINLAIEDMSPRDLEAYHIYEGRTIRLYFEGDISVSGEVITGKRNLKGKILLISFRNCTVKHKETQLFRPEWGIYDMAIGKKITSAYAGAADEKSFELEPPISTAHTKPIKTAVQIELETLYQSVQDTKKQTEKQPVLRPLFEKLKANYPTDWLLCLEIIGLLKNECNNSLLQNDIVAHWDRIKQTSPHIAHLIDYGSMF
jgi:phenylalanine-4-hydroxylase